MRKSAMLSKKVAGDASKLLIICLFFSLSDQLMHSIHPIELSRAL